MAPTSDGDFQAIIASKFDGVSDIIGVGTTCNQGGSSLRAGIPIIDASRRLITGVGGQNQSALEPGTKFFESFRIDIADFHLTRSCRETQRSSCGERPLDKLATTLSPVKSHGWKPSRKKCRESDGCIRGLSTY